MHDLLDLLVSILAGGIYGTEKRPRPAWLRNVVRLVAFGGAAISVATMLSGRSAPPLLALLWIGTALIVLIGEYELGSRRVFWAAVACAFIVVSIFVSTVV